MYTQFFGNFLLSKGYITNEQLFDALKEKAQKHAKLGTLAILSGLMTAAEVDSVIVEQTHQDKKFGELTIEMGYLPAEQVKELFRLPRSEGGRGGRGRFAPGLLASPPIALC